MMLMPVTWYVAKVRASYAKKFLKKGEFILDVGAGRGTIAKWLKKDGYVIKTLDIEGNSDYRCDARKMIIPSHSFDHALCFEVLEHVDCLDEMKRVVKKGGLLICSSPEPRTDHIRRILVKLRLLEDQDFRQHDQALMKDWQKEPGIVYYKKMFLGTSQFFVIKNDKKE